MFMIIAIIFVITFINIIFFFFHFQGFLMSQLQICINIYFYLLLLRSLNISLKRELYVFHTNSDKFVCAKSLTNKTKNDLIFNFHFNTIRFIFYVSVPTYEIINIKFINYTFHLLSVCVCVNVCAFA